MGRITASHCLPILIDFASHLKRTRLLRVSQRVFRRATESLQADPRVGETWSSYAYADNNAVMRTDPDGQDWDDGSGCSGINTSGCSWGSDFMTGGADLPVYEDPDDKWGNWDFWGGFGLWGDRPPGEPPDDPSEPPVCCIWAQEAKRACDRCGDDFWVYVPPTCTGQASFGTGTSRLTPTSPGQMMDSSEPAPVIQYPRMEEPVPPCTVEQEDACVHALGDLNDCCLDWGC